VNPKLKKAFFYGGIVIAANVILIGSLIAVGVWMDRSHDAANGADVQLAHELYGGTPTRFGVVVKHAGHDGTNVTLNQSLIQVLASKSFGDGNQQVVITSARDLLPEIGAKLENGDLDIAKFAEAGTVDMLVSAAQPMQIEAILREKKDGNWKNRIWANDFSPVAAGFNSSQVSFPDLNSKIPTFALTSEDSDVAYYAADGNTFSPLLNVALSTEDLVQCLNYRSQHPLPSAVANTSSTDVTTPTGQSSGDEAFNPGDPQSAEGESNDGATDSDADEPDFLCANVHVTLKVLPKLSSQWHEIQADVEGEGVDHIRRRKSYVLWYSPKDKRYGFRKLGKYLDANVVRDFADNVLAKSSASK
jgi:hypothetical protein